MRGALEALLYVATRFNASGGFRDPHGSYEACARCIETPGFGVFWVKGLGL